MTPFDNFMGKLGKILAIVILTIGGVGTLIRGFEATWEYNYPSFSVYALLGMAELAAAFYAVLNPSKMKDTVL